MGTTVRTARHWGRIPSQMHALRHVVHSLHTVVTPLCTITTYRSVGRDYQVRGRRAGARQIGGGVLGRRQREGALGRLHPDAESNQTETIIRDHHSLTTSCFGTNSLLSSPARLGSERRTWVGTTVGTPVRANAISASVGEAAGMKGARLGRVDGDTCHRNGHYVAPMRMKNAAGMECVAMVASHGSRRE
jgi:hypothetical protein